MIPLCHCEERSVVSCTSAKSDPDLQLRSDEAISSHLTNKREFFIPLISPHDYKLGARRLLRGCVNNRQSRPLRYFKLSLAMTANRNEVKVLI
jgi:hypothetical protein